MLTVDAVERLDRVIHEKGRLALVSLLAAAEQLSFTELKELTGMTDGNLLVHLRTLEECGYVAAGKRRQGRKARTEFWLTEEGRAAFRRYIDTLDEIVRRSRAPQRVPAGGETNAFSAATSGTRNEPGVGDSARRPPESARRCRGVAPAQ